MSNPTTTPPMPPEQRLALEQRARYDSIVYKLATGGAIICPLIILLPPRKLDLYTFSLGVGFYLSADHLFTVHTGRGLVQQLSPRSSTLDAMPTEKARDMQRIIREEREKGRRMNEGMLSGQGPQEETRSVFGRLWMGDEKEGWKERRMEEERKALEEGKGYMDMIFEHVWEVWNWDKKKGGDEGKK
ncbi:hypothetical protein ACEQ8H_002208 [Pleosporales sp. CAS-2024a]